MLANLTHTLIILISVIGHETLGLFQDVELHTYTTIMPILPILQIHIFSNSYEFADFPERQKVTNVVKKWVKKLSVQQIFPAAGIRGFWVLGSKFRVARLELQIPPANDQATKSQTFEPCPPRRSFSEGG